MKKILIILVCCLPILNSCAIKITKKSETKIDVIPASKANKKAVKTFGTIDNL